VDRPGVKDIMLDLPNAELHFVDTGHFALEECGDEIAELIGDFLDRSLLTNRARPEVSPLTASTLTNAIPRHDEMSSHVCRR
jgi:hypothetical protein